jgi:hypothetical protein
MILKFFLNLIALIKILFNIVAMLIGIAGVTLAYFYYVTPAGMLPPQMPGFIDKAVEPSMVHAMGALAVGLAAFFFTWMVSGATKKKFKLPPEGLTTPEELKL